jgi:cell division protein FtsA
MEETVQAIVSAVREAELSADCEIHNVIASLGGAHIKGFNSHGVAAVHERDIESADVERVSEAARAVALPNDQDILHVLMQEYLVNGQEGIKDPVGMSGVRLESRVHVITTSVAPAQNVIKCCQRSGLHVADLVLAPLAAAEAVLTAEEKEIGVAVVDVGAGTTGLIAFCGGAARHTAVLPVGGNHVSSDISAGLRTPFREAERLKLGYGAAIVAVVTDDEVLEVSIVGGRGTRAIPRSTLVEIIGPRFEEIFALVKNQLERCGLDQPATLASGIVLTGGSVLTDGVAELAERVLQLPVRVGTPVGCSGIDEAISSPAYAAAVGLTRHGAESDDALPGLVEDGHLFSRVGRKMVGWLRELV